MLKYELGLPTCNMCGSGEVYYNMYVALAIYGFQHISATISNCCTQQGINTIWEYYGKGLLHISEEVSSIAYFLF